MKRSFLAGYIYIYIKFSPCEQDIVMTYQRLALASNSENAEAHRPSGSWRP